MQVEVEADKDLFHKLLLVAKKSTFYKKIYFKIIIYFKMGGIYCD